MDINVIQKVLKHRYPFLMIDRVNELVPGKSVTAIKNVSMNESYFGGHMPGKPIMPGTLIVEAMAQTAILLYQSGYEKELDVIPDYYLGSIKAYFKNPVFPGDQLRLEAKTVKLIPTAGFVEAKAFVQDKEIAEAELVFAVKR